MAFNIYYINYPKVYEIKMMFDNFITVAKEIQNDIGGNASAHLGAKMGLGFLKLFRQLYTRLHKLKGGYNEREQIHGGEQVQG